MSLTTLPRVVGLVHDEGPVRRTLRERLLANTSIDLQTGCWNWTRHLRGGYGRIKVNGRYASAHRVAFELIEGPIPEGLKLDHLCRNRACVNPAHLEPVTQKENVLRSPVAVAALYAVRTHCAAGHEFNEKNTRIENDRRVCRVCHRDRTAKYRAERKGVAS